MTKRNRRKSIQRRALLERMEARLPLAGDASHNFLLPGDVNGDQTVTAGDALAIINALAQQRHGSGSAPEGELVDASIRSMFYDVNDDGQATASDALRVINELASAGELHQSVEWLEGASGARAKIELQFSDADRAELEVRLTGAPANQAFDLMIGGEVLGQMQTNEFGNGKLELKYGGVHPAVPGVLANADGSTLISIGDIVTGTFASLGEIESDDGSDIGSSDGSADGGDDSLSDADEDDSSDGDVDGAASDANTDASTDVSPDRMPATLPGSPAVVAGKDADTASDERTVGDSSSVSSSLCDGGTDGGVDGMSDGSSDDASDDSPGSSDSNADGTSDGDRDRGEKDGGVV